MLCMRHSMLRISWESYGPQGLCFPIGKQRICANSRPCKGDFKRKSLTSPCKGDFKRKSLTSPCKGDFKRKSLTPPCEGDFKRKSLTSPL